jgi:protein-disulfide isomerase
VEIVEFADFQCPFCIRAHPTVTKVLSTYGDKVRFVYRNFPLASHPDARPAAEAGACAAEQGKFWELHDRLFAGQTKLGIDDLKQHAAAVGVDAARFNSCFDQRKFQKDIDADMEMAADAGVNATPAFFVNGRPLIGAQPFEAFKRLIDEELAAVTAAK